MYDSTCQADDWANITGIKNVGGVVDGVCGDFDQTCQGTTSTVLTVYMNYWCNCVTLTDNMEPVKLWEIVSNFHSCDQAHAGTVFFS